MVQYGVLFIVSHGSNINVIEHYINVIENNMFNFLF